MASRFLGMAGWFCSHRRGRVCPRIHRVLDVRGRCPRRHILGTESRMVLPNKSLHVTAWALGCLMVSSAYLVRGCSAARELLRSTDVLIAAPTLFAEQLQRVWQSVFYAFALTHFRCGGFLHRFSRYSVSPVQFPVRDWSLVGLYSLLRFRFGSFCVSAFFTFTPRPCVQLVADYGRFFHLTFAAEQTA